MPDPFATLGVAPDVSERELAAAYRRLAKQWHPDHLGGDGSADERMVALNAAYAQARAQLKRIARSAPRTSEPAVTRRRPPGAWLPAETRKALGAELLTALVEDERIEQITSAGSPARGPIRLVVTDRRLLWLVEDAVTARLDWVRYGLISRVEVRRPLLRGRGSALLRLHTKTGKRFSFGDMAPEVAHAIAARALAAATP